MNQGGALIQVYRDGSVLLSHGGTEMGQGLFTKTIQVKIWKTMIQAKNVSLHLKLNILINNFYMM